MACPVEVRVAGRVAKAEADRDRGRPGPRARGRARRRPGGGRPASGGPRRATRGGSRPGPPRRSPATGSAPSRSRPASGTRSRISAATVDRPPGSGPGRVARAVHEREPMVHQASGRRQGGFLGRDLHHGLDPEVVEPPGVADPSPGWPTQSGWGEIWSMVRSFDGPGAGAWSGVDRWSDSPGPMSTPATVASGGLTIDRSSRSIAPTDPAPAPVKSRPCPDEPSPSATSTAAPGPRRADRRHPARPRPTRSSPSAITSTGAPTRRASSTG